MDLQSEFEIGQKIREVGKQMVAFGLGTVMVYQVFTWIGPDIDRPAQWEHHRYLTRQDTVSVLIRTEFEAEHVPEGSSTASATFTFGQAPST